MSDDRVEVAVIGGGAAGLAAAHALRASGCEFRLFEAAERAGGVMQTSQRDGFLVEAGPSTFRVTGAALGVLRAAGVEGRLTKAAPESLARYLLRPEGLVPVPLGPGSLLTTSLLSAGAKLRLVGEPFVRRRRRGEPETVAAFVARRLGPEVVDALVGPFLVGVYAGDERKLGAEAVFPSLVGFEERSGSIVAGALRGAFAGGAERGLRGSYSTLEGVGGLADALAAPLGEALWTDAPVRALEPDGQGWVVLLEGELVRADRVVLATDAAAAAGLLAPHAPDAAAFCHGVAYAPMVSMALDVDPTGARHAVEGFGFLVPRDLGIDLLGALFMSRLFPGRAPEQRELVTAMIGGLRWPGAVDAPEDEILRRVEEGLERSLGLKEAPRVLQVSRWRRAVPQPVPGHRGLVRAARAALVGLPPIALCASYLDGVSVSDTLVSGWNAARSLRQGGG